MDKDFRIHVLNNLPKDYNVILNGLENHLMVMGDDMLTINMICEKLNYQYKKIKNKKEQKVEKEKASGANNSISSIALNVASMAINLEI